MQSWFCNGICNAEDDASHQIILIYKYTNSIQITKQARQDGFIMMKKCLFDEHLLSCRKINKKFTDEVFPPTQDSLFSQNKAKNTQAKNRPIIWKRISQLYPNYQLANNKIQPTDILQSNLKDCYFLAAISALAQNPQNILQIFQKKDQQSMAMHSEYGIYKVVVNIAGRPEQLLIDDYIPVYEKSLKPVHCKPVNSQFWVVLLQKAWAKLSKSYDNITYGNPHQVLTIFSVAPVFHHKIYSSFYEEETKTFGRQVFEFQQNLWKQIKQASSQGFPVCSSSRQKDNGYGIKPLHSYAVLAAYQLSTVKQSQRYLQLRNPWEQSQQEVSRISKQIMNELYRSNQNVRKRQNDCTFIITYQQFLTCFESIDILHFRPKYNYIYQPVDFKDNSTTVYYKIVVQDQGQIYITFQTSSTKDIQKQAIQTNYISKILVAQEIEQNQFQFVDCALQASLADVTVRCRRLKRGSYIVMVQCEDSSNQNQHSYYLKKTQKKGTISLYSNTKCFLQQVPAVGNFLFDFFRTHAIKYCKNQRKILGPNQDNWIAKKLLQQSGYGYICINLDSQGRHKDQKGGKKFLISIDQRLIAQNGYKFKLPSQGQNQIQYMNSSKIDVQLWPGNLRVFLFKINFNLQKVMLSFPPQGFDIKKII